MVRRRTRSPAGRWLFLVLLLPLAPCAMKKDVLSTQNQVNAVRGNLQELVDSIDKRQAAMSEEIVDLKRAISALKSRDDEFRQLMVTVQQKMNVTKIETDENLRHLTDLNREYQKALDGNLRKLSDGLSASVKETGVKIADVKSQLDELHALEDDQNRRLGETTDRLNVFLEEANTETGRLAKALQEVTQNYNLLVEKINALNKDLAVAKENIKEVSAAAAGSPRVHVIKEGENLSAIATRYGVTVEEIIRANNLSDPDSIRAGQRLNIP